MLFVCANNTTTVVATGRGAGVVDSLGRHHSGGGRINQIRVSLYTHFFVAE